MTPARMEIQIFVDEKQIIKFAWPKLVLLWVNSKYLKLRLQILVLLKEKIDLS